MLDMNPSDAMKMAVSGGMTGYDDEDNEDEGSTGPSLSMIS
jgi:uncharacterized membrane protein